MLLSLNISLICFASSRFYGLSPIYESWRHAIIDRFPSTTTFYKFERDTIYIAHVFHQSQDYARLV